MVCFGRVAAWYTGHESYSEMLSGKGEDARGQAAGVLAEPPEVANRTAGVLLLLPRKVLIFHN